MTNHTPQVGESILIVDDNADARRLLTLVLKPEGHRLLVARDGREALHIVERVAGLSLVLLDIMMPGTDGLEVCRCIRRRETDSYLPIILVSALSDQAHIVNGLAAGADDYITKPLAQTEVIARVRAALRLKRALDALLDARELAAVGAIAVTLGHEINNPLTTVLGNIELVLRNACLDEATHRKLGAAYEGSVRIRQLVKRLTRIEKVVTKSYVGSVEMLDIDSSCRPESEPSPATSDCAKSHDP